MVAGRERGEIAGERRASCGEGVEGRGTDAPSHVGCGPTSGFSGLVGLGRVVVVALGRIVARVAVAFGGVGEVTRGSARAIVVVVVAVVASGHGKARSAVPVEANRGKVAANAGAIAPSAGVIAANAGAIGVNAGALGRVAGALASVAGAFGGVAGAFASVAGAFGRVAGALASVAGAFGRVAGVFASVAAAFGRVAGAFASVAAAFGRVDGPFAGSLAWIAKSSRWLGPKSDTLEKSRVTFPPPRGHFPNRGCNRAPSYERQLPSNP